MNKDQQELSAQLKQAKRQMLLLTGSTATVSDVHQVLSALIAWAELVEQYLSNL